MKKSVSETDVAGKRVLLRVDFNVPMQDGQIIDDTRLHASIPTIRYLVDHQARVILLSHLGRPNGYVVEELRMNPIAERLSNLLRMPVLKINNCVGPEVQKAVNDLQPGQILFLENVRFHPGETVNDLHFASQLAQLADLLVNDAFSSAHRLLASTVGITRYIPAVAGLLMERELTGLLKIRNKIRSPVVSLLGGIRLADKGHYIDDNLENKNRILVGGVLANTFLHARGYETGQSRIEAQVVGLAREFLVSSRQTIELPVDVLVSEALDSKARQKVVSSNHVPPHSYIVDIGPATMERYIQSLSGAQTIIWNGPMGLTRFPAFSKGTEALAKKIASQDNTIKIAGGGDTLIALDHLGLTDKFDFLSTGGAAFLDALGNESLPAIRVLQGKEEHTVVGTPDRKFPTV